MLVRRLPRTLPVSRPRGRLERYADAGHVPGPHPSSGRSRHNRIENENAWRSWTANSRTHHAVSSCSSLDAGREGLQHVAYWTKDYQALYDHALSLGYTVGHEGQIGGEQGRFAYFDTQLHPGTVIELSTKTCNWLPSRFAR